MTQSEFSEDLLVQRTTLDFLTDELGWDGVMAWNNEVLGESGTFGRKNQHEVVLSRYLWKALKDLNPDLPQEAYHQAVERLTQKNATKTLLQRNREMTALIREGVKVEIRDSSTGEMRIETLRIIDFHTPENNQFLAVRELWVKGSAYLRRPDVIGYINGLPLVFIELKAPDKDVVTAYNDNLSDYRDTIPDLFIHNALVLLSNGKDARVGTYSSSYDFFHEWKRLHEEDSGVVDWETMLRGVCDKTRLLDIIENFIHFDDSPEGGTIKVLAANHQYLGVNLAFEAVQQREVREGKLGVFWHTQGSGKSYSMLWLSQKVHRKVAGSFTFVIVTDRAELDTQIAETFVGCGAVSKADAPVVHASSRKDLKKLLAEDHRYIFTLIHKFDVDWDGPCTERNDVIVIADEAHRTQNGQLAEAMRRALPNAAFIAFTGTPLMKSAEDQLTRETFGHYVSVYDFQRAVADNATVPLYYDNRGEKLKLVDKRLNARMQKALAAYDLDQDQTERLERDLSRDYHILTSQERLKRVAEDLAAHYALRWNTGKAMLVCLDKITCVRMYDLLKIYWAQEIEKQQAELLQLEQLRGRLLNTKKNARAFQKVEEHIRQAMDKLNWLRETEMRVVISGAQNEVRDFKKWGLDILPHRQKMNDRNLAKDFKDPAHPFRLVIVCAMWLTGFDVPSLSTVYIDKPMKGHTLMQTIARANRKAIGKHGGLIVDYNGMLKSLRAALATYGDGTGPSAPGPTDDAPPVESLDQLEEEFKAAVAACGNHLSDCGFDLSLLEKSRGFERIALLSKDSEDSAVNAVCQTDATRAKFEILARDVFRKRKALVAEPQRIAEVRLQADAVHAIYKQLQDNKEQADISHVMQALHAVVSDSVSHDGATREPGSDSGKTLDISHIDFEKLKEEFARNPHKNTLTQSLKAAIEKKLKRLIAQNPTRVDFYERYNEIIEAYNRETDRVTIERTFQELLQFHEALSEEETRAIRENLDETQLYYFDLLRQKNNDLDTRTRNRLKEVATGLLDALRDELAKLDAWSEKSQTKAQVKQFIYDYLYDEATGLPTSYSVSDIGELAEVIYLDVMTRGVDRAG